MKKIYLIFIILVLSSIHVFSLPEFAMWTGNPCIKCHVDPKGGGMRNAFGWQFGKDASLYIPEDLSLEGFYNFFDKSKYDYFNKLIALGFDFRTQYARSFAVADAPGRIFPMQASLYANSQPFQWLLLNGQYNFGPKIFEGQQNWMASVTLKPFDYLPDLRAGFFQPTFGMRQCDMTSLDRRIAAPDGTEVLIAPDYAEYGAELHYGSLDWLQAWFGMFNSKSLSELTLFGGQVPLIAIKNTPLFTAKFMFYPQSFFDFLPFCYIGASGLINRVNKTDINVDNSDTSHILYDTVRTNTEFNYMSVFCGVSAMEDLQFFAEYDASNKPYSRFTHNYIAGINYVYTKGVILSLRYENGTTDMIFSDVDSLLRPFRVIEKLNTIQAVLTAKIVLLPYIEFIPEYRFMQTEEFKSTRWTCQVHVFY